MIPWIDSAEPSWVPKWNENRALNLENGHLAEYTTTLVPTIDLERGAISTDCIILDRVALHSTGLYPNSEWDHDPVLWRTTLSSNPLYAFWNSVCSYIGKLASDGLKVAWLNIRMCDALYGKTFVSQHSPTSQASQRHGAYKLLKSLVLQEENMNPKQRKKTFLGTARNSLEMVESSHPLSQEDRDAGTSVFLHAEG